MIESILDSIKDKLGNTYDDYTEDIIMEINAAFAVLTQIGVGPKSGFAIEGSDEKWSDYTTNKTVLSMVKKFIELQCKVTFDPPNNSFVLQSMQDKLQEYTWRLNVQVDPQDQGDIWTD